MNDNEKDKEYEEFLKLFEKSHPSLSKVQDSAPDTNLTEPQQSPEKQNDLKPQSSANPSVQKRKAAKKYKQRRMAVITVIPAVVLILSVLLIVKSCSNNGDVLRGTWNLDGVTVYLFDGKGAGSLNLPGNTYPFTYEIKENEVSIDFESDAARDITYSFTVEKDKLILKCMEKDREKTYELTKEEAIQRINGERINVSSSDKITKDHLPGR